MGRWCAAVQRVRHDGPLNCASACPHHSTICAMNSASAVPNGDLRLRAAHKRGSGRSFLFDLSPHWSLTYQGKAGTGKVCVTARPFHARPGDVCGRLVWRPRGAELRPPAALRRGKISTSCGKSAPFDTQFATTMERAGPIERLQAEVECLGDVPPQPMAKRLRLRSDPSPPAQADAKQILRIIQRHSALIRGVQRTLDARLVGLGG